MRAVRVGSWRWWFENRKTHEITIAQFPNWPLVAIGIGWLAGRLTNEGSTLDQVIEVGTTGLWFYWGFDELIRGVNPWRRSLGLGVIGWQSLSLIG